MSWLSRRFGRRSASRATAWVRPQLEVLEGRLLLSGGPTTSTSITEFTIPTASSSPVGITTGPDGNLWFAQSASPAKIGRMTTSGVVTEFTTGLTSNAGLLGITAGPDGNLWFAEQAAGKIGRITTSGVITEFTIATSNAEPAIITAGPDGNLWFTEFGSNKIGRITTSGAITEFTIPTAGSRPNGITVGSDNALWFTESGSGKIGRITTSGVVTEYSLPNAGAFPDLITAGPDGNLWFTEAAGNKIGTITTSGVITEFSLPTANAEPVGITMGPDGNLWFTEFQSNKIGDITTSGVINEFSVPTAGAGPILITLGPDNALWFTELNGNKIGRATAPLFQGAVTAVSAATSSSGGTTDFVQFSNGTVYSHLAGSSTLTQVTSAKTTAISAGTDTNGNADVTVEFAASASSLWTHTGSNQTTGWTNLVFSTEASTGATIRSFVAGLNGVVDVVFSDNTLWQANLANPTGPIEITNKKGVPLTNVSFVAIGTHNGQEADFIAFNDNGGSNGGVWERYGSLSSSTWVNVTSLDAYAISASQDLSDTADLIVSSRNAPGIIDHQVYGYRGTPGALVEVTSAAVSSVAIDAGGNDYYVLQSNGSVWEHLSGTALTSAFSVVTATSSPVVAVIVPNGVSSNNASTFVLDVLFANDSTWQITNGTGVNKTSKPLAS